MSATDGAVGDAVVLSPPLTVTDAEHGTIRSRLVATVHNLLGSKQG